MNIFTETREKCLTNRHFIDFDNCGAFDYTNN